MPSIDVYGDKRRVRQVLLNLIGNAIKFTHHGEVRIDVYDQRDDVKIAVSDTGIGMKQEDLSIIFERFRQADGSAKRTYEGTGLGLAITKEMVELQHGKIWVESEVGKGSTFYFTVPKKPFEIDEQHRQEKKAEIRQVRQDREDKLRTIPEAEKAEKTKLKAKAKKGNGETILVVDDELINVEALRVALSQHNYKPISALEGVKGLKEAREKKPDAIILDLMMPGLDGYEFCKMAKKDEAIKDIPIIVLTAKSATFDKVEIFNAGADDYVVKPFDNEELVARIQVILRRKHAGESEEAEETEKEPVSKQYALEKEDEFKEEQKGNGELILIIDDEPINLEVLQSRLELNNYRVLCATNGEQGLQIAKEKKPDLIMLDLMMPKMSGYEFCKEVRKDDTLNDTPLIMLTAKDSIEDKIYGLNLGADDYMTKPFNKNELVARVHALLRMKALQNELKQFTQRLADLFGVGTTISSIFETDELYTIIVDSASDILQADKCTLLLCGRESLLTVYASTGLEEKEREETKVPIGEGVSGRVAQQKEPLLCADLKEDEALRQRSHELYYTNSLISVPLVEKGEVIGVLNTERAAEPFTKDDLQILLIFATQAAIAIGNTRLVAQEKKLTKRMAEAETRAKYADILQTKNKELEEAYEELKTTQKQLIHSEKMATIGILAGGVAHEINTPLGTIITNTEMLRAEFTNTLQQECLNYIEKSANVCKTIVEQLLKYSRKPQQEVETVNLGSVIDEICLMLEYAFNENRITINREYNGIPAVQGSPIELRQVFTNIIVNSIDAINNTKRDDGVKREGMITIKSVREGEYVSISITDNGEGISEENLNHIFDPFFTTKKIGKGTGLGLSVSHKIIENHNGKLEVQSKVGGGTTFTVKLPINGKP